MSEAHDPRPIERVFVQLWVEVLPTRPDYAMKYVGDGACEVWDLETDAHGERSMERFSPQTVADTIKANMRRDLDSMWQIGRIDVAATRRYKGQFDE